MIENDIKNSIKIFNKLINDLISAFTKYNLDEQALVILAKRTKYLMSFTHKTLLKLMFKFFKTINVIEKEIIVDYIDVDEMIDSLFEQISISLNNLLNKENDKSKQDDIEDLVEYLKFLKDIINTLSNLFLSVLKFEADITEEDDLREDYRTFKKDITEYKVILDYLLEKEMVNIPIE